MTERSVKFLYDVNNKEQYVYVTFYINPILIYY